MFFFFIKIYCIIYFLWYKILAFFFLLKKHKAKTRPSLLHDMYRYFVCSRSSEPIVWSWRSFWRTRRLRSTGFASLKTSRVSPCSKPPASNPQSWRKWWTCCRWHKIYYTKIQPLCFNIKMTKLNNVIFKNRYFIVPINLLIIASNWKLFASM